MLTTSEYFASPSWRQKKQSSSSANCFIRGGCLQSGKTEILSNSEARSAFDGVNETIKELNMELAEEIAESAEAAPYVTPGEI